jgi:hypothetical protein
MSYTTPPTFVAGDVLEADQLNVLSDDIADLDSRVAGVTMSALPGVADHEPVARRQHRHLHLVPDRELRHRRLVPGLGHDVTVPAGAVPAGATTIGLWLTGASSSRRTARAREPARSTSTARRSAGRQARASRRRQHDHLHRGRARRRSRGRHDQAERGKQTSGGALNVLTAKLQFHRIGVAS